MEAHHEHDNHKAGARTSRTLVLGDTPPCVPGAPLPLSGQGQNAKHVTSLCAGHFANVFSGSVLEE